MNIFDATLELKKYRYKKNPQLIKIGKDIELSGPSILPIMRYLGLSVSDYKKSTTKIKHGYVGDMETIHTLRRLKNTDSINMELHQKISPSGVNTKEYWRFLHEEFPFCDVASYYRVTDLASYFSVKGRHYDLILESLTFKFFEGKRILEIGPGYGYLNKILTENNIKHQYYCADIVKRFDHDNFIDINGYDLLNINDKFDIVFMTDVSGHLGSDIFNTYSENIRNLLNIGGVFIDVSEQFLENDSISSFFGQLYFNHSAYHKSIEMSSLGYNTSYRVANLTPNNQLIISIHQLNSLSL